MPIQPIRDWGEAILTSLAAALAIFLAAIPQIIGFLVILLIGWFIANLIARAVAALLRAVRFNNPNMLASIARIAVWSFALIVAVNQIGIAQTLVNTLFFGLIGALALSL